MPAIHQMTAGFTHYDAISNEALMIRELLRRRGFVADIFSEPSTIKNTLKNQAFDAASYTATAKPDDVVILHLSMGSKVNDLFQSLPCRKVILYHNITPGHYFDRVNMQTATHLRYGQQQMAALAGTADLNLADSHFNASELEARGYKNVGVLPIIMKLDKPPHDSDRHLLKKLSDGKKNILFVGRCTPNKMIEDLIRVFAYYQKTVEPQSRLIQVGSSAGCECYFALLQRLVEKLGLRDVCFPGTVPQAELHAYYQSAHAFLCMSEHEGFCIPLLESMLHEVPIVARAAAAIPETLDGSGILLDEPDYALAAEALGCLTRDATVREAVVRGQNERLDRLRKRDLEGELLTHLKPLLV